MTSVPIDAVDAWSFPLFPGFTGRGDLRGLQPRPLDTMTQLRFLGLQVIARMPGRLTLDAYSFYDLQPVAFQSKKLTRIVSQQTHLAHAEICEYLGTDSIVALIGPAEQDATCE